MVGTTLISDVRNYFSGVTPIPPASAQLIGVLRLRSCFASRTSRSAQDDSFKRGTSSERSKGRAVPGPNRTCHPERSEGAAFGRQRGEILGERTA